MRKLHEIPWNNSYISNGQQIPMEMIILSPLGINPGILQVILIVKSSFENDVRITQANIVY